MPTDRPRLRTSALAVGALVVLGGAAAFLALRPGGRDVEVVQTDEERAATTSAPPPIEGPAARPAAPGARPDRRPASAPDDGGPAPEEAASVALEGTVVEDATGRPVEGATVLLRAATPDCPAPPDALFEEASGASGNRVVHVTTAEGGPEGMRVAAVPEVRTKTGAGGRFTVAWVAGVEADVYARKPGFAVAFACRQSPRAPVTLRLREGGTIEGLVTRESGDPVPGASVECVPDPAAQGLVGHRDVTHAGERGEFALRGLFSGAVRVTASHPKYVPTTSEPVEPGMRDLRLVLVPAFLVTLRIVPDDAKEPEAPTVEWRSEGRPPRSDLVMLHRADVPQVNDRPGPGAEVSPPGGFVYPPLAVPCDRATVTLTVKAIGYAPWVSDPIELPREGGETTLEVPLRRDPNLGRLVVRVENERGAILSWTGEACEAQIGRRDGQPVPAGIILQAGDTLDLPALPSGPYTLRVLSPKHAPARLDATVPAGGIEEAHVRLGPPAKVRVKFTAPDALIVRFRLLQGREVVRPYPENGTAHEDPNAPPGEQALQIGAEGVVLSGLATGRYVVEVVSPDLEAPPTSVDLVEGETKEVEIAVTVK